MAPPEPFPTIRWPSLAAPTRDAPRRRRCGLRARAALAVALALLAAGCGQTDPADTRSSAAGARLRVINESDYEWLITVTAARGGKSRTASVGPRLTRDVVVPGGEYEIEQSLAHGPPEASGTRRLTHRLKNGQTYRWVLTTLLSGTDNSVASAGSVSSPEHPPSP